MFPLILLREILSVLTDWLWYWKLSVSMMSKTLHCIFLQIKTIMSVLKVLTYIMTSIRSSYLAIMSVLIFISDYCHWKPSYQEKKVEISFTGLTPYFCACPKLGPGFPMSYVMVFFAFDEFSWDVGVIVRLVDIGGIDEHHFLFIILFYMYQNDKTVYQSSLDGFFLVLFLC
jgi:hypothetical protein